MRQLDPQRTLGEEIYSMRRRLAISLDSVVETTKIQKQYLRAIEANEWNKLPEPIYTRNFIRAYVQFLGGDVNYFLSRFNKERASCDFMGKAQIPRQKVRKARFMVASHFLKFGFLAIILLGLFGYIGFQIRSILEPPQIIVTAPDEGYTTETPVVLVTGEVKEESLIVVNGKTILPAPDGTFQTEITLERGLNVITVEGKKRYSRPSIIYRTILFDSISGQKLSLD